MLSYIIPMIYVYTFDITGVENVHSLDSAETVHDSAEMDLQNFLLYLSLPFSCKGKDTSILDTGAGSQQSVYSSIH